LLIILFEILVKEIRLQVFLNWVVWFSAQHHLIPSSSASNCDTFSETAIAARASKKQGALSLTVHRQLFLPSHNVLPKQLRPLYSQSGCSFCFNLGS
jgi:hypothetical protein